MAAEHLPLAVDAQELDVASQLSYTRRALALRHNREALMVGTMKIVNSSDSILAFERCANDERLLCVFNLSGEARTWTPSEPNAWRMIESSQPVEEWTLPALAGWVAERSL
jgi:alpha-glucosidase